MDADVIVAGGSFQPLFENANRDEMISVKTIAEFEQQALSDKSLLLDERSVRAPVPNRINGGDNADAGPRVFGCWNCKKNVCRKHGPANGKDTSARLNKLIHILNKWEDVLSKDEESSASELLQFTSNGV